MWYNRERMENEEHKVEELQQENIVETQHEAHHHARSRMIIGIGAIIVLILITIFIWPKWGNQIKEACFGDGDVCEIELPNKG